jgi:hypothetical protein
MLELLDIARDRKKGTPMNQIDPTSQTILADLRADIAQAKTDQDKTFVWVFEHFFEDLSAVVQKHKSVRNHSQVGAQERLDAFTKKALPLLFYNMHQFYAKVQMLRQKKEQQMHPALLEAVKALEAFNYSALMDREGSRSKNTDSFFDEEWDEDTPRVMQRGKEVATDDVCEKLNRVVCRHSGNGYKSNARVAETTAIASQEVELENSLLTDAGLAHINNNANSCLPDHDFYVEKMANWLLQKKVYKIQRGRLDICILGSNNVNAHPGQSLDGILADHQAAWTKVYEHFRDDKKLKDLHFTSEMFSHLKKVHVSQEDEWTKIKGHGHHGVSMKLEQRVDEIHAECVWLEEDSSGHVSSRSGWEPGWSMDRCKDINKKPKKIYDGDPSTAADKLMAPLAVRERDYYEYCQTLVALQSKRRTRAEAEEEADSYQGQGVLVAGARLELVRYERGVGDEKVENYLFFAQAPARRGRGGQGRGRGNAEVVMSYDEMLNAQTDD